MQEREDRNKNQERTISCTAQCIYSPDIDPIWIIFPPSPPLLISIYFKARRVPRITDVLMSKVVTKYHYIMIKSILASLILTFIVLSHLLFNWFLKLLQNLILTGRTMHSHADV